MLYGYSKLIPVLLLLASHVGSAVFPQKEKTHVELYFSLDSVSVTDLKTNTFMPSIIYNSSAAECAQCFLHIHASVRQVLEPG